MISVMGVRSVLIGLTAGLLSCQQRQLGNEEVPKSEQRLETLDLVWTPAAAKRTEALVLKDPARFSLPELRLYDADRRLIFRRQGTVSNEMQLIDAAIAERREVDGPSFVATVRDLQARDGRLAATLIDRTPKVTVVDYWAEWCVPCKVLEKQLDAWATRQPTGSVTVIRAEADLTKLAKARGQKVYKLIKGPDGVSKMVEMRTVT